MEMLRVFCAASPEWYLQIIDNIFAMFFLPRYKINEHCEYRYDLNFWLLLAPYFAKDLD